MVLRNAAEFREAKGGREGKPECKPIQKVEWKSSTSGYVTHITIPTHYYFQI